AQRGAGLGRKSGGLALQRRRARVAEVGVEQDGPEDFDLDRTAAGQVDDGIGLRTEPEPGQEFPAEKGLLLDEFDGAHGDQASPASAPAPISWTWAGAVGLNGAG